MEPFSLSPASNSLTSAPCIGQDQHSRIPSRLVSALRSPSPDLGVDLMPREVGSIRLLLVCRPPTNLVWFFGQKAVSQHQFEELSKSDRQSRCAASQVTFCESHFRHDDGFVGVREYPSGDSEKLDHPQCGYVPCKPKRDRRLRLETAVLAIGKRCLLLGIVCRGYDSGHRGSRRDGGLAQCRFHPVCFGAAIQNGDRCLGPT